MSYHAHLKLEWSGGGGAHLDLVDHKQSGLVFAQPLDVTLAANETRNVTIAKPLPTAGSSDNGIVVLATDSPGVKYRVATNASTVGVRDSGWLLTGGETILSHTQDGATTPVFTEPGSWIYHANGSHADYNTTAASVIDSTDDDVVTRSGSYLNVTASSSPYTTVNGTFVWGVDDYVDLGGLDDGKEFELWVRDNDPTDRTAFRLVCICYPYTSAIRDDEVSGGGGTDLAVVADAIPGSYFYYDFHASVNTTGDNWNAVRIPKTAFSTSGSPLWSRVTQIRVEATYATAGDFRFGGLYFGDPPDSVINSVAVLTDSFATRTSLVVSLTAPASGARVVGGAVMG